MQEDILVVHNYRKFFAIESSGHTHGNTSNLDESHVVPVILGWLGLISHLGAPSTHRADCLRLAMVSSLPSRPLC